MPLRETEAIVLRTYRLGEADKIISLLTPRFLHPANFLAIARGFSVEGIVVVGMSMLLIAGAFDLSVASVMALSGIIAAWLIVKAQCPIPVAILGGLAVGATTGTINGIVVTFNHKHFKKLVARAPAADRQRFRNLGRISLMCAAPRTLSRLEKFIEAIEFHHRQALRQSDKRLMVELGDAFFRVMG